MALLNPDNRPHNSNMVTFYQTYHFRAIEQDPIVDKLQTLHEDAGSESFKRISEGTGLSTTTLYNWFHKRSTRRPQYASVAAFARFMGYDFALVKVGNKANGKPWKASEPRVVSRSRSKG